MSAERDWIIEPQPAAERRKHSVEAWAERHRLEGHHLHPAPTDENPERWECKCDPDVPWTTVWHILTPEQIRQKFAHLGAAARARKEGRRLPEDDPAWQERIPQAKQRVAEWEQSQGNHPIEAENQDGREKVGQVA